MPCAVSLSSSAVGAISLATQLIQLISQRPRISCLESDFKNIELQIQNFRSIVDRVSDHDEVLRNVATRNYVLKKILEGAETSKKLLTIMEEIERTPSIAGNASELVSRFSGCLCANGENLTIVTRKLNWMVERSIMPTCLVVLENLDYDYGLFENDYSGSHEHEKMTPLTPRLFGDIGYIGSPSVLNAEGEAGEPRSCPSPHIRSWVHDPESSTFQWMSQPIELMPNIYDCVVIGSGYGGGLAAARMAQTGESVSFLQRGEERWPGEFPSDKGNKAVSNKTLAEMYGLSFGNEEGASNGNEFEGDGSINANLILADTVATVTSSLCAWVIRQYDKSLDHQSITPHERQLLEHSIFQLTKLFEQPLLPVLTIGLVYAAGVSTVYYLHRHDKYLNPALGLGSCTAIAAGLLQGMGMRGAIVQLVPGAVALALLLSGVFHYLFVAESKQRQCDIHTGSKFHWDRAEWTKWIYHDEDDMKLESQQPDQVLLDEKNMV